MHTPRLIVALDDLSTEQIVAITGKSSGGVALKVNDLLMDIGYRGIRELHDTIDGDGKGFRWMLDPKSHDIGNTLENGMKRLKNSGMAGVSDLFTVHASGGMDMLSKVASRRDALGMDIKLLAISVLTSMTDAQCREVYGKPAKAMVLQLATIAKRNGMDGMVCSPEEARMLREYFGDDFLIVTPGIRLDDGKQVIGDDQKRISTPRGALENGASDIVVGRPITQSDTPDEVIQRIKGEMNSAQIFVPGTKNYKLEQGIYNGSIEDILKASGNIYRKSEHGPYVRLTSDLLSDGYINIGGAVEADSRILERFTRNLADELDNRGIGYDIVLGAAMGSVRLSDNLGRMLGIPAIYTEKVGKSTDDTDVHALKRHNMDLRGKKVVISEDVITKAQTTKQLIKIVQDAGGEVTAVTCVANRTKPSIDTIEGIPLISLWVPPAFGMWYDDRTPGKNRGEFPRLPDNAEIEENPKANWVNLVKTM